MDLVAGHAKSDESGDNVDTQIGDTAIVRIYPDTDCLEQGKSKNRSCFYNLSPNLVSTC